MKTDLPESVQPGLLLALSSFVFGDIYLSLGREKNHQGNMTTGASLVFESAQLVIVMSLFFLKQGLSKLSFEI